MNNRTKAIFLASALGLSGSLFSGFAYADAVNDADGLKAQTFKSTLQCDNIQTLDGLTRCALTMSTAYEALNGDRLWGKISGPEKASDPLFMENNFVSDIKPGNCQNISDLLGDTIIGSIAVNEGAPVPQTLKITFSQALTAINDCFSARALYRNQDPETRPSYNAYQGIAEITSDMAQELNP